MSALTSIGAAIFSDLSVCVGPVLAGVETAGTKPVLPTTYDVTTLNALFVYATNKYAKIKNVREFPAIGSPANIVNVPVYGSKTSQSVGGQADAPTLEMTINYVPNDWVAGTGGTASEGALPAMIGDGLSRIWRFTLLNADPTLTTTAKYDSSTAGLGTVGNAYYYFVGRMESLLVTPSLTDATTAKISISLQSPFYGAYSI